MSYARRTDANHREIVAALRRLGWHVVDTSRVGHGFPDCIAIQGGHVKFIEIKDGSRPPSERKLTRVEQELHDAFEVAGASVVVLETLEQALRLGASS